MSEKARAGEREKEAARVHRPLSITQRDSSEERWQGAWPWLPPSSCRHKALPRGAPLALPSRCAPVDGAAVDERRELAQSVAERIADGREAEHDVKVLARLVHKVVPQLHLGGRGTGKVLSMRDV